MALAPGRTMPAAPSGRSRSPSRGRLQPGHTRNFHPPPGRRRPRGPPPTPPRFALGATLKRARPRAPPVGGRFVHRRAPPGRDPPSRGNDPRAGGRARATDSIKAAGPIRQVRRAGSKPYRSPEMLTLWRALLTRDALGIAAGCGRAISGSDRSTLWLLDGFLLWWIH